jgi:phosphate:Na+ symporter
MHDATRVFTPTSTPMRIIPPLLLILLAGSALAQESGGGAAEPIDWFEIAMQTIAGLVIFLWGVHELSASLKTLAGERMRQMIGHATGDRYRALAAGTAATVLLDSSSLTIILLITFVDAGLMSLLQAMPFVLGANIGTTFSSQIFALGIDDYAPLILLAGFLARVALSSERSKATGTAILGAGLVLFGLNTIGSAAEPLQDHQPVIDWLAGMATPIYGILAGAAITVLLQSSSAMMGIIITLAGQGLIPLEAGIAMMLGAEIGTCADTLVATAGRSREAFRVGLFHLLFNIVSVLAGALLIGQIVAFAEWTSGDMAQQVANAHVAFNVGGALVALVFIRTAGWAIERLVPVRAAATA